MDPEEAQNFKYNIFDMTKIWPHKEYPLRQIGTLTVNRNVRFFFFFFDLKSPYSNC